MGVHKYYYMKTDNMSIEVQHYHCNTEVRLVFSEKIYQIYVYMYFSEFARYMYERCYSQVQWNCS